MHRLILFFLAFIVLLKADVPVKDRDYVLFAWNDLGMHCMDDDFSVFSILPPFNTFNAQLIRREGTTNKHVTTDVTISYEAASFNGESINSKSSQKTNFWQYAPKLFNVKLEKDSGLAGYKMASKKPQPMHYSSENNWWEAVGIPITPYSDDGTKNSYPMVKLVAKNSSGKVMATTQIVIPVSDEMDCKSCHASGKHEKAEPLEGWLNHPDKKLDYKYNILRLHDENDISEYLPKLKKIGYSYKPSLLKTAQEGTPILCASCHRSNALLTKGFKDIKSLTRSIHLAHAKVKDPTSSIRLGKSESRDSCYRCHPGRETKCLRGAMGNVKSKTEKHAIECQNCHGSMLAVAKSSRRGWIDEPTCQSCHQDGKRYHKGVTDVKSGTLREALDRRFATQKGELYRFSVGHGDLHCSVCHGSTHAIYPSKLPQDNLQSILNQGDKGTIGECRVCHKRTPKTNKSGPHGMHSAGKKWIRRHATTAELGGVETCKKCHGKDFRGTFLSQMLSTKELKSDKGKVTLRAGHKVSCYDCHENGPDGN